MSQIRIYITGELIEHCGTCTPRDEHDEIETTVRLKEQRTVGKLTLSTSINHEFSPDEVHQLFDNSDSKYAFAKKLLEVHPTIDEVLEQSNLTEDDVTFRPEDPPSTNHVYISGDKEQVVKSAAQTTQYPGKTLLEYATLRQSYFSNLPTTAKSLLESEIEKNELRF